jgi:hypothetical protein
MGLWGIAAREQIRDTIARYAHSVDGGGPHRARARSYFLAVTERGVDHRVATATSSSGRETGGASRAVRSAPTARRRAPGSPVVAPGDPICLSVWWRSGPSGL